MGSLSAVPVELWDCFRERGRRRFAIRSLPIKPRAPSIFFRFRNGTWGRGRQVFLPFSLPVSVFPLPFPPLPAYACYAGYENLLSPTIFGLKCDEKLEHFFSSNVRDMGKVMPVVFGEIKMSFWVRNKAS